MRRLALVAVTLGSLALAGCTNPFAKATPTPSPTAKVSPSLVPGGGTQNANVNLAGLQQAFTDLVTKVRPSVVEITTDQGLGSGVIFDSKGDIVTNYHVVEGSASYTVTFSDGSKAPATLVGSFRADDLAVVHVTSKVTPLAMADSSQLKVGDIVLAVGNPLGFSSSVTEGVVSATGRTVPEGNGVVLVGAIQTSAAINPGNSGGALVDISGSLVGIPTLAALDPQLGGAAPGIGFAIPSNTVNSIAAQLVATGHVANTGRSYLGITPQDLSFGNGVYVARVFAGSPAANAGIQAGDIIDKIDDTTTNTVDDLQTYLANKNVGDVVKVEVVRGNVLNSTTTTVSVTLAALPGS